jgi:hypothetical protein
MRSDEGEDGGDFLLFDRRQRQIYSVVIGNRSVLQIDGKAEVPQMPDGLAVEIRRRTDQKAPMIEGKSPLEIELLAAGELCRSAVVAPGFLEPVRAALQEYGRALAIQQLRTLDNTPATYQTPCFLSRYLYAVDFHLEHGMLLAEWSSSGERRELTAYETDVPVAEALFLVPEDFAVLRAGGN